MTRKSESSRHLNCPEPLVDGPLGLDATHAELTAPVGGRRMGSSAARDTVRGISRWKNNAANRKALTHTPSAGAQITHQARDQVFVYCAKNEEIQGWEPRPSRSSPINDTATSVIGSVASAPITTRRVLRLCEYSTSLHHFFAHTDQALLQVIR